MNKSTMKFRNILVILAIIIASTIYIFSTRTPSSVQEAQEAVNPSELAKYKQVATSTLPLSCKEALLADQPQYAEYEKVTCYGYNELSYYSDNCKCILWEKYGGEDFIKEPSPDNWGGEYSYKDDTISHVNPDYVEPEYLIFNLK